MSSRARARGPQKVLTYEEAQQLKSTFVVLWYANEDRVDRHSAPLCLSSHHFAHYADCDKLNWNLVSLQSSLCST